MNITKTVYTQPQFDKCVLECILYDKCIPHAYWMRQYYTYLKQTKRIVNKSI